MNLLTRTLIATLSLLLWPALAHAQAQEKRTYEGDFLTIGAGLAYGPSFEGADEYDLFPIGGIMGRVGPVTIAPRVAGVALDLIPDSANKISFSLGPVARARFDRTRKIRDPAIAALGRRNTAIELGGTAGVTLKRVTNPYDMLSFSLDVRRDVAKAHRGTVVAPSLTYLTPLSRGSVLLLNLSAEHVDTAYARYYFDVSPAGAMASGLPGYTARGGWKSASATLMGVVDLDGDLLNGGFALVGGVAYTRLLGSVQDSPIVAQRGAADQLVGAIGMAFTF